MSDNWLVDAESPLLDERALARLNDTRGPHRLAWNSFRTLALWDTDRWVPRLVEVACGEGSPLVEVEWGNGAVRPWVAEPGLDGVADVVLEGPEAVLVVLATLDASPPVEPLCSVARRAAAGALQPGKPAGLVVVVPPVGAGSPDLDERLRDALGAGPGTAEGPSFVEAAVGWLTWREVGEVALDLAEEADELLHEPVHQLTSELQAQFPDVEL